MPYSTFIAACTPISRFVKNKCHDNITVVLAEFNGEELKEPTPDARVAYQQYPLPPEDPKDPDPAPRQVSIKSGGPKPGHDVKRDPSMRPVAVLAPPPSDAAGGRWFLIGVLVLVFLLLAVAIMLFLDDGARSEAPARERVEMLAAIDPGIESCSRLL